MPLLSIPNGSIIFGMSTHDTHIQYKLRMPPELRDKLKEACGNSHRSMNAEIVARLDESFSHEALVDELIPASKAKELSASARGGIDGIMRKRVLRGISQAVAMGHSSADVSFSDMTLDSLPGADQAALLDGLSGWLEEAGYRVEWDGVDSVLIIFDDL